MKTLADFILNQSLECYSDGSNIDNVDVLVDRKCVELDNAGENIEVYRVINRVFEEYNNSSISKESARSTLDIAELVLKKNNVTEISKEDWSFKGILDKVLNFILKIASFFKEIFKQLTSLRLKSEKKLAELKTRITSLRNGQYYEKLAEPLFTPDNRPSLSDYVPFESAKAKAYKEITPFMNLIQRMKPSLDLFEKTMKGFTSKQNSGNKGDELSSLEFLSKLDKFASIIIDTLNKDREKPEHYVVAELGQHRLDVYIPNNRNDHKWLSECKTVLMKDENESKIVPSVSMQWVDYLVLLSDATVKNITTIDEYYDEVSKRTKVFEKEIKELNLSIRKNSEKENLLKDIPVNVNKMLQFYKFLMEIPTRTQTLLVKSLSGTLNVLELEINELSKKP